MSNQRLLCSLVRLKEEIITRTVSPTPIECAIHEVLESLQTGALAAFDLSWLQPSSLHEYEVVEYSAAVVWNVVFWLQVSTSNVTGLAVGLWYLTV
jgi:hypothetical protein